MTHQPEENRFPALDHLRSEFTRVARSERPDGRRRFPFGRLGIAAAVIAIASPIALAVAETTFWSSDEVPPEVLETGTGGLTEDEVAERARQLEAKPATSGESDFTSEGRPPASLVRDCRGPSPGPSGLHCAAILAIDEGRLEPGTYSDEELKRILGS